MEWNDNFTAFTAGGLSGAVGGLVLKVPEYFMQVNPVSFAFDFPGKLLATIILAAAGGLTGLIVKDLYSYNIRPWLKRKKILKQSQ
jgi:hypothetical protein